MEAAMANPQSSVPAQTHSAAVPHLHLVDDVCPLCDQAIPHDRANEVANRLKTRDQAQSAAITEDLLAKFESEKSAALEAAHLEADQKILAAQEAARVAAALQSKAQIDTAETARIAALAALDVKTKEVETEKASSEATRVALQGQIEEVKIESTAAIEKIRADAVAQEEIIRLEAIRIANEAMAIKIADAEAKRLEAEKAGITLKAQLEDVKASSEQALEEARLQAATREAEVRAEVSSTMEAAAKEKIDAAEEARAEAEGKAAAAENRNLTLQQSYESQLNQRLQEQRDALEAASVVAVNAEKAAAFVERQKLSNKVDELSRALEKKTAEEIGEGAEIDLFEALKGEFESDRIERVNKGQAGADILHTIIHNGQECGKIIYDSKSHNSWRNEFATKLRSDQMSAQADHAILSSHKFPAGFRHLHLQDGVMIAGPARVISLAQIVRAHLVQTHTLRMSTAERAHKTAALYDFITSQQCADLFSRLDEQAEALLDIQVKEKKAHEKIWKDQGLAIRSAMKVQAELRNQIDLIIGTAPKPEKHQ